MLRWAILILIALLVILQYRLWVGEGGIARMTALQRQIEEQKATNARLEERNSILDARVQDLKEGLDGIEERARSELGMVKPGEQFIVLMEKQAPSPNSPPPPVLPAPQGKPAPGKTTPRP